MNEEDPIQQYISRADHLATAFDIQRALAQMDSDSGNKLTQAVADIFADAHNMHVARKIVQHLQPIKNNLLHRFGIALHKQLEYLHDKNPDYSNWKLIPSDRSWTKSYAMEQFIPDREENSDNVPFLLVIVQRTPGTMNIGVSRSEPKKNNPHFWDLPEVQSLFLKMRKEGYRTHHLWWQCYKLTHDLESDEFYLSLAGDFDNTVEEIADFTWNILLKHGADIIEANDAIYRHTQENQG